MSSEEKSTGLYSITHVFSLVLSFSFFFFSLSPSFSICLCFFRCGNRTKEEQNYVDLYMYIYMKESSVEKRAMMLSTTTSLVSNSNFCLSDAIIYQELLPVDYSRVVLVLVVAIIPFSSMCTTTDRSTSSESKLSVVDISKRCIHHH